MIHEPPFHIDSRRVASDPAWECDPLVTYAQGLVGMFAMLTVLRNSERFAGAVGELAAQTRKMLAL